MMNTPVWMPVLLAVAWLTLIHISAAADWGYSGDLGPSTWKERYPSCGGKRQSPINVLSMKTITPTRNEKSTIKWKNFNKMPISMKLINNGHSVQLKATPKNGRDPYLEIDSKVYVLDQTHFHWGKKDKEGSEHTFDNRRYPLEMHAVHRRVVNGTQVDPPEVIVVTILFEIAKCRNRGLDRFLKYVPRVKKAETEVNILPFPADTVIPPFNNFYFVYEGSLTTPPCSEVVTFFIRKELATVTSSQMEILRVTLNEEGEELAGNFRPVQAINGRLVTYVQ